MLGLVFCTSFIFTDFQLYRLHVFLWLLSVTVCTSIPLFVNNFASMDSLPLFSLNVDCFSCWWYAVQVGAETGSDVLHSGHPWRQRCKEGVQRPLQVNSVTCKVSELDKSLYQNILLISDGNSKQVRTCEGKENDLRCYIAVYVNNALNRSMYLFLSTYSLRILSYHLI